MICLCNIQSVALHYRSYYVFLNFDPLYSNGKLFILIFEASFQFFIA